MIASTTTASFTRCSIPLTAVYSREHKALARGEQLTLSLSANQQFLARSFFFGSSLLVKLTLGLLAIS
jgi:hypothetical protein